MFSSVDFLAFQRLNIDYVIGESHKEFLPNSSGPAAIIRIFGVTREGYMLLSSNVYSLSCGFCWRVILSYYVLRSQCVLSGAWVWTIFLHQLPARNEPWWYFRLQTNTRGFYFYPILSWPFCSMKVLWKYILSLYILHNLLQARMKESNRNSSVQRFVKSVELLQKQTIMHYQPNKSQSFLKIVVALPTMVASCRGEW